MAERPSRPQPFRFWMPSYSSSPNKSAGRRVPSRQKSQTETSLEPPAQAESPPPSSAASRRPTLARRDSRPPTPTSSQNRRSSQSQPRNQDGKQPSRSRLEIQSPSATRAASKSPMSSQSTSSYRHSSASAQVKSQLHSKSSSPNSQPKSPATKRSSSNKPVSLPHETKPKNKPMPPSSAQPIPEPTKEHIRQDQNFPHVTINSLEQTPLQSYASEKEIMKINVEKMEPFKSHMLEDGNKQINPSNAPDLNLTSEEIGELNKVRLTQDRNEQKPLIGVDDKFNGQTDVAPMSSNKNAENTQDNNNNQAQDGANRKERKIAITTIPEDSFFDGKRAIFKEEIKEGLSRLVQKINAGHSGQFKNGSSANVITLAGKNNGASMVIGYEGMAAESFSHTYEGHKLGNNEVEACSSKNGGMWNDDEHAAFTARINNNVQSINNSAIDESSCHVGNPGVHLKLSSRPMEALVYEKTREPLQTERRASRPIPNQKPTHEPRIRRRCLRALMMESSESDIENPQKPRRHGCRFNCEDKKKDANQMPIVQNNGETTSRA
ncbi:proteoglycan 4 [Canna indica]|uniref:Proteoglycan 4 n=1 Tax=Canna indica TaxID=4628 RepID=A0AAQ3L4Z1_9LILI|nr:proteoglycan 4 [Canna indica]